MSGHKTVSLDLAAGQAVARALAAQTAQIKYGPLPRKAVGVAVVADQMYYWVRNESGRLALESVWARTV